MKTEKMNLTRLERGQVNYEYSFAKRRSSRNNFLLKFWLRRKHPDD